MQLNTKLSLFINKLSKQIDNKFIYFQIYFYNSIFFLFLGFLIGNLFGSLLNIFQQYIIWTGLITILIVIFTELVSYLMYCKNTLNTNFLNKKKTSLNDYKLNNSFYRPYKNDSNVFLHLFRPKTFYFINLFFLQKMFYKKINNFINKYNINIYCTQLKKNFFYIYCIQFLYIFKNTIFKIIHVCIYYILYINNKIFFFIKKKVFIKSLNLFKIGILLGLFIDAFKVGS